MDDATIEKVARSICANLGIDPDEQVGHGYGGDFTPREWADHNSNMIPAIGLLSPRWRLFRGQAAMAIATSMAVTEAQSS